MATGKVEEEVSVGEITRYKRRWNRCTAAAAAAKQKSQSRARKKKKKKGGKVELALVL